MQETKAETHSCFCFFLDWINLISHREAEWFIVAFTDTVRDMGSHVSHDSSCCLKKGQLYFQYIFSPAVIHLPRYMSFFKVWEIQLLIKKKKNTVVRMCNLIVKYQVKLISIQYKCHDSGCKILVMTVTEHLLVQGIDFKDSSLRLLIKEKPRALSVPCCCVY